MSVGFIGCISHQESSEIHLPDGPPANPPWIAAVAQAHEDDGFDPLEDALARGRDLLPPVHAAMTKEEARTRRLRDDVGENA